MDAETTGELEVAVVGVVGDALEALTAALAVDTAEPDGRATTQLATLDHRGPVTWTTRAVWDDRVVALVTDGRDGIYAATADGALRTGDGRRYPLPLRRGLTAVAAAGPGALVVAGPGALGQVRLGGGRIAVTITEDDGATPRAIAVEDGRTIAVGDAGALWSRDGDDWVAHETGLDETLTGASWLGDRAIVVGAEGGVFAWDGAALTAIAGGERGFTAVTTWRGVAYLADGHAVWRLDGGALATVRALPVERLAVAADALFAFAGTLVARFDGAGWSGGPIHAP